MGFHGALQAISKEFLIFWEVPSEVSPESAREPSVSLGSTSDDSKLDTSVDDGYMAIGDQDEARPYIFL